MELFENTRNGFDFLFRYGHVLSGITWIGLLYFFNFVQVPAYAELSDTARPEALRKVTWRALWWFRYAALSTFLFGLALVLVKDEVGEYFKAAPGYAISVGMLFGITMFLNVWGVIWRMQKIVIGSAETVANGGQANPEAPAAAKKAARASRANTFMSFTMLWFMIYTPHMAGGQELQNKPLFWIFVLVAWGVIEASALGLIGGIDNAINKTLFDKHQDTIRYGILYFVVFYVVAWELILTA